MFQMMNEARLMVGANAAATASVAYHESLEYARERTQGRAATDRDPTSPQRPIIEHADVRRMLLRQKAIAQGSIALVACAARYSDLADHAEDAADRERCQHLLDALTPVVKSFPAEHGYEANALAVQVLGGYGYTSEYLPEAFLRDQKLNSIHEGTTGIQGLDLLGRKATRGGGVALRTLAKEIGADVAAAREAGVDRAACDAVTAALGVVGRTTATLGALGLRGDVDAMLRHSTDYLTMVSILAVAWQWLRMATATRGDSDFELGIRCTADYWIATELPRVELLGALCSRGEDSYARIPEQGF